MVQAGRAIIIYKNSSLFEGADLIGCVASCELTNDLKCMQLVCWAAKSVLSWPDQLHQLETNTPSTLNHSQYFINYGSWSG